jgi:CRP/FNR family transcriptional regulator, nitrogen oxide reductase regulator
MEFLRSVRLFSGLAPEVIQAVAERFRARHLRRGEFAFLEGDRADALNLLVTGRIKVVRETEAGREAIIRLIEPGEIFGSAGGWGEPVYPASAVAQEEAEILRLPAERFLELIRSEPDFAVAVVAELGARLRDAAERIRDLQTEQVEQRIARALVRQARKAVPAASGALELSLSRKDLAELSGTTLSTASRTLSDWARRGIVAGGRERVRVLDVEALMALADRSRAS